MANGDTTKIKQYLHLYSFIIFFIKCSSRCYETNILQNDLRNQDTGTVQGQSGWRKRSLFHVKIRSIAVSQKSSFNKSRQLKF